MLLIIQNGGVVRKRWEIGELAIDLGKGERRDGKRANRREKIRQMG
jgi:hypothetical protein